MNYPIGKPTMWYLPSQNLCCQHIESLDPKLSNETTSATLTRLGECPSHSCAQCHIVSFPTLWLKCSVLPHLKHCHLCCDISPVLVSNIFEPRHEKTGFLAHLSQRLIGELIGYSWSGVRPSASVRRKQFQTSSSPKPLA